MAFDLVTKFLLAKALKFGQGEIDIYGIPVVLNPADYSVFLIHDLINSEGYEKAHDIVYKSAKEGTQEYSKALRKNTKSEGKKLASLYEQIVTLGGYGTAKITSLNLTEQKVVCRFDNSPIAKRHLELFGKVPYSVDMITNGLYAGAFNVLFNENNDSIETHCIAKGDLYCEFVYGPKDSINELKKIVWDNISKR